MQPLFTISTSCYFKSEPCPSDHTPNRSPQGYRKLISGHDIIQEEQPTSLLSPPSDVSILEEPDSETTPISDVATPTIETPPILETTSSPLGRKSVVSREKKSVFRKAKKGLKMKMKKKGSESPDIGGAVGGAVGGGEEAHSDDSNEESGGEEEQLSRTPSKPKHLPLEVFTRKKSSDSLKALSVTEGVGVSGGGDSKSPDDYVVVSLINNVPCKKSEELAVHQSYLCPYAKHLSIANISGHVLVFGFSVSPPDYKPQVSGYNCLL